MIPKVIHQIWLGPMRPPFECIESWRRLNPGWEHRLWTEENLDFIFENQAQYEAAAGYNGKSDVLRYEILKRHGGVYLDADSVCIRPLDDALRKHACFAAYENERVQPGLVASGAIGCMAGHPAICDVVRSIGRLAPSAVRRGPSWQVVGPALLTEVVGRHPAVKLLPSHLFYPYHHTGMRCSDEEFVEAYAVQLWGSTIVANEVIEPLRRPYGFGNEVIVHGTGTLYRIADRQPVRNDKYELLEDGEDGRYLLWRPDSGRGFAYNRSAALVWELCDGFRTVGDLYGELRSRFPDRAQDMERDLYELLLDLERHDLLRLERRQTAPPVVADGAYTHSASARIGSPVRRHSPPATDNVTALIPVFNEPWIGECVLSIAPYVREIVVADSGSDSKYLDRLYEAAREAGNVRIHTLEMRECPRTYRLRTFLDEYCGTEWCLMWDGDFIAYDDDRCITRFFDAVAGDRDTDRYRFHWPYVSGDVDHHVTGKVFHPHRRVLYRRGTAQHLVGETNDDQRFSGGNETIVSSHHWLSVDLKPVKRMAFRGMMDLYCKENRDPLRLDTLWKWLYHRETGGYPMSEDDARRAAEGNVEWFRRLVRSYTPFDYGRWGPHPPLLTDSARLRDYALRPAGSGYTLETYPVEY